MSARPAASTAAARWWGPRRPSPTLRLGGKRRVIQSLTIALDAMGGDNAPKVVVRGVALARIRHPQVRYLLFGDERRVAPLIRRKPKLRKIISLVHTDKVVPGDMKQSLAL